MNVLKMISPFLFSFSRVYFFFIGLDLAFSGHYRGHCWTSETNQGLNMVVWYEILAFDFGSDDVHCETPCFHVRIS